MRQNPTNVSDNTRAERALEGASGAFIILSANPMHDTGGGQRSAQMALEFLARDHAVLFVSHGVVTESVNLGLSFSHPRLAELALGDVATLEGRAIVGRFLSHPSAIVLTQIPVSEWLPVLQMARDAGAVSVYDLIDEWDSELGYGWYRRRSEKRILANSDLLTATAPSLQRYLLARSSRSAAMLPNAFNDRLFDVHGSHPRPVDLPSSPVAIYVGSLWGRWMDWRLVDAIARALPHVACVYIGDYRGEGGSLPSNCHFLGLKPQRDLPQYLAHSTVGLLPWKNDRVTQATSPLKVYEYMAMGLPVVGPDTEPLRGLPGVTGCTDHTAFIETVRQATLGGSPENRRRMSERAAAESWRRRVDVLLQLVAEFRRRPRRIGWLSRALAWADL